MSSSKSIIPEKKRFSKYGNPHSPFQNQDRISDPMNNFYGVFLTEQGKRKPGSSLPGKQKNDSLSKQLGTAIHKMVQAEFALTGKLGQSELTIVDAPNMMVSSADIYTTKGEIVEVKTVALTELMVMRVPRPEHKAQLIYYLSTIGKEEGTVLYVARESPGIRKAFKVNLSGEVEQVRDAAIQYMREKRHTSDSLLNPAEKASFALSNAIEKYETPLMQAGKYGEYVEEVTKLRKRQFALEKKKAFDQAYKMAHRGMYEAHLLNEDGMPAGGLAQQIRKETTAFGSPWQGKKEWFDERHNLASDNKRANILLAKAKSIYTPLEDLTPSHILAVAEEGTVRSWEEVIKGKEKLVEKEGILGVLAEKPPIAMTIVPSEEASDLVGKLSHAPLSSEEEILFSHLTEKSKYSALLEEARKISPTRPQELIEKTLGVSFYPERNKMYVSTEQKHMPILRDLFGIEKQAGQYISKERTVQLSPEGKKKIAEYKPAPNPVITSPNSIVQNTPDPFIPTQDKLQVSPTLIETEKQSSLPGEPTISKNVKNQKTLSNNLSANNNLRSKWLAHTQLLKNVISDISVPSFNQSLLTPNKDAISKIRKRMFVPQIDTAISDPREKYLQMLKEGKRKEAVETFIQEAFGEGKTGIANYREFMSRIQPADKKIRKEIKQLSHDYLPDTTAKGVAVTNRLEQVAVGNMTDVGFSLMEKTLGLETLPTGEYTAKGDWQKVVTTTQQKKAAAIYKQHGGDLFTDRLSTSIPSGNIPSSTTPNIPTGTLPSSNIETANPSPVTTTPYVIKEPPVIDPVKNVRQIALDIETIIPSRTGGAHSPILQMSMIAFGDGEMGSNIPRDQLAAQLEKGKVSFGRAKMLDFADAKKMRDLLAEGDVFSLIKAGHLEKNQVYALQQMEKTLSTPTRKGLASLYTTEGVSTPGHRLKNLMLGQLDMYINSLADIQDPTKIKPGFEKKLAGAEKTSNFYEWIESRRNILMPGQRALEHEIKEAKKLGQSVMLTGHNIANHDINVISAEAEMLGVPRLPELLKQVQVQDTYSMKPEHPHLKRMYGLVEEIDKGTENLASAIANLSENEQGKKLKHGFFAQESQAKAFNVAPPELINRLEHTSSTFDAQISTLVKHVNETADTKEMTKALLNFADEHAPSLGNQFRTSLGKDKLAELDSVLVNPIITKPGPFAEIGTMMQVEQGVEIPTSPSIPIKKGPSTWERMKPLVDDALDKFVAPGTSAELSGAMNAIESVVKPIGESLHMGGGQVQDFMAEVSEKIGMDLKMPPTKWKTAGLMTAGAIGLAGVGLTAMLSPSLQPESYMRSTPIRPIKKRIPLTADDEAHNMDYYTGPQAEAMRTRLTDFGSGYKGFVGSVIGDIMGNISTRPNLARNIITKELQTPITTFTKAPTSPHLIQKEMAEQAILHPNQIHGQSFTREITPSPIQEVKYKIHSQEYKQLIDNNPGYEMHNLKMQEMKLKREAKFRLISSQGTRPVFESNFNKTKHHVPVG